MRRFVRILLLTLTAVLLLAIVLSAIAQEGNPGLDLAQQQSDSTILLFMPVVAKPTKPIQTGDGFDMAVFMIGDRRLYEVWQSINNSQARHQTQIDGSKFFHTKNSEWEELWATGSFIYRGTDTSPGNGEYYTLRDYVNKNWRYGSRWAPRFWKVGQLFERNPLVTFYKKDNCNVVVQGTHRTWLKFEAYHPTFTFPSGITLADVVQFAWLLSPKAQATERYYYARDYGLVGWSSNDRGFSHISEIHAPGARPDNNREHIGCLNTTAYPAGIEPFTPIGPLPPPYIYRVK